MLIALQRLRVGQALEAGLAIVLIAVILDRMSAGMSRQYKMQLRGQRFKSNPRFQGVPSALLTYIYWSTAVMFILFILVLQAYGLNMHTFPAGWQFSIREPVDAIVRWMRDNLYQIGNLPIGSGPFSDFMTIWMLNPIRDLLQSWLPWPAVILGAAMIAYFSSGWRLAIVSALALFFTGLLGLWSQTMDTLSQVLVAGTISLVLGLPLGVWSAHSDQIRTLLRPVLDFLQTIPVFVYLVPVIMLFNIGRVPGIIASVFYAVPPVIRLTDLGIRSVSREAVEAADAFGATTRQKLYKVLLPLAMPSILMGINQTMMMVLSMVIIAGLVGGGGLGLEAVNGLAKNQLGLGMEAGLAIVFVAIILDRVTQAWAKRAV